MKYIKELFKDLTETSYRVGGNSSYGDTLYVIQSNGKTVGENLHDEITAVKKNNIPEYVRVLFSHLYSNLDSPNFQSICNDVKRKLIDIKNKEQNGEIKPV